MSDLTTPQEILNLVKRISTDPRSSGRRLRILRGMLYNICMDLEQPNYGVRLMIKLGKTLSKNGQVYSCCLVFLARFAGKWIKQEIPFFVLLVVNLFKSVDSMLENHVKYLELEPTDERLYVLIVFSKYFESVGEQITENVEIKDICSSLMEKMYILLPGFLKRYPDIIIIYFDILKLVYRTAEYAQATDALQEFCIVLTDNADSFRRTILLFLDKLGTSWFEDHGWLLQFMEDVGLEGDIILSCARSLLPSINSSIMFHLQIDRDNLLGCSRDLLDAATTTKQLQSTLNVTFLNEIGRGDGLVREWFVLVAEELVKHKILVSYGPDKRRVLPSREAMKKGDRFLYVFVGKIIALAMMHNVQLGITFDRLLYLGLAGKDIGIEDFKETDPKLYLSWKNCLDKEDDETVLCVEESIDEFLDSIYEKIEGIKSGFKSASLFVFPESANFFRDIGARGVDNFLLGDTADISVQDWMNHTDYVGYTKDDPQISWFWKVGGKKSVTGGDERSTFFLDSGQISPSRRLQGSSNEAMYFQDRRRRMEVAFGIHMFLSIEYSVLCFFTSLAGAHAVHNWWELLL
ncbi:hypothetical protein AgCh_027437 [Apium graveolens]